MRPEITKITQQERSTYVFSREGKYEHDGKDGEDGTPLLLLVHIHHDRVWWNSCGVRLRILDLCVLREFSLCVKIYNRKTNTSCIRFQVQWCMIVQAELCCDVVPNTCKYSCSSYSLYQKQNEQD